MEGKIITLKMDKTTWKEPKIKETHYIFKYKIRVDLSYETEQIIKDITLYCKENDLKSPIYISHTKDLKYRYYLNVFCNKKPEIADEITFKLRKSSGFLNAQLIN